jgi:very-short-patch-repair endonuclease
MPMQTIREILTRIPPIMAGAYESPAEECLGERLRSAINPTANYQTQVWVETSVSRFRLDILLIDKTGRRVVVEVDGKEFHEPVRDHWRTVFIMGERQADVVYRVPASDLKINLVGVLAGLAEFEPMCFSEDDITHWKAATDLGWLYSDDDDEKTDWGEPEDDDDDGLRSYHWRRFGAIRAIESRFSHDRKDCERAAIKIYYDFAIATGLKDLDAIQEAWKLAHPSNTKVTERHDQFDFSTLFE